MTLHPQTYREFVDEMKGAARAALEGVQGERLPTPMLHVVTDDGIGIAAIDTAFFDTPGRDRRVRMLIERFVIPMVERNDGKMVGWTFAGGTPEGGPDLMTAIAIDREVHEVWIAPLAGTTPNTIGTWVQLSPNKQVGRLITPIQEALR